MKSFYSEFIQNENISLTKIERILLLLWNELVSFKIFKFLYISYLNIDNHVNVIRRNFIMHLKI
jgi:hypothetical protein